MNSLKRWFDAYIETAKSNDLEPYWYLRYLFTKLPFCKSDADFRKLLPYRLTMGIIRDEFSEEMV